MGNKLCDTIRWNKCDVGDRGEGFPNPSPYKNKAQAEFPDTCFMLPKRNKCFT